MYQVLSLCLLAVSSDNMRAISLSPFPSLTPSKWHVARRSMCAVLVGGVFFGVWFVGTVLAQSGSAPVGVASYSVAENSTISLGVPLLRPSVTFGVVGAATGTALTFASSEGAVALPLVQGESYFIEVVGHADGTTATMVGQRFEVDEAATRAGAIGNVVLDLSSPLNTSAATAIGGLVNYRVAVRPHWTLASLLGTGTTAKANASSSAALADQVLAWNGTGFSVYYLRSGDVPQWRNIATGPANQDGAIVPPGVGVYLRRRTGSLTFSVVGEVRTNSFVRAAFEASQLVAGGFPVESSPADWKFTSGTGLTAGTSPVNSDQLLTWSGSVFSQYYLRNSFPLQWRNAATGVLDQTNAKFFPALGATLLILRAPAAGTAPPPQLAQPVPFSL